MNREFRNWDIVKENVEPLKTGRDVQKIISSQDPKLILLRETKRAEYEKQIILERGEKIEIWLEFISWIEQNYPDGGANSKIDITLKDCINRFIDKENYHNDERFFDIFKKHLKTLSDPLELLNSLFHRKLFCNLASFYKTWSSYLEMAGNFKKADEVIELGIISNAQPKEELEQSKIKLQMHVARKFVSGTLQTNDQEDTKRQALAGLKGKTMKRSGIIKAPVERASNSIKCEGLKLSSLNKKDQAGPSIFIDEIEQSLKRTEINGLSNFVLAQEQENELKAGKWTDNRFKQRSATSATLNFEIFEDDEKSVTSESLNKTVLKTKKKQDALEIPIKTNPINKEKFYFDEKMLYIGGTEYSFEEVRYMLRQPKK